MNGCSAIHLSIFGMEPIRKYGSPELANEILPKVADGSLHAAFGVTEPDAGALTLLRLELELSETEMNTS